MKKSKIAGLLVTMTMLLTGCGIKNNKSSEVNPGSSENSQGPVNVLWSSEEQQIIKDHLYNVNLPYLEVIGSSKLVYDDEYDLCYKEGGISSASLLENYANLFLTAGWMDNGSTAKTEYAEEEGYYYSFEYEVTTSEGKRYLDVMLCGTEVDADGNLAYSLDGSGTFFMQVGDPYFYEWPKDFVDYLLLDVIFTTEQVPAFEGADVYQVNDSYLELGILAIYAYTDNANAQSRDSLELLLSCLD